MDPGTLVEEAWTDAWRRRRRVAPAVLRAILAAMGPAPDRGAASPDPVRVARPGERLPEPGELTLEDGTALGRVVRLASDLPAGYHRLATDDGEQLLLTAPRRCHLPATLRGWGWA
ncbi:MAG: 4-alpha-glucanotransferase, partial [Candidatus Limnocylindria bacterium]